MHQATLGASCLTPPSAPQPPTTVCSQLPCPSLGATPAGRVVCLPGPVPPCTAVPRVAPQLCCGLLSSSLPLWSLPPFLLLSLRTAALPCMRCASKAHHLILRDTLLQSPAKRAVQCSWLACQLYILCPASGRLPADTVLVAPIADPCTKGFRKAKASRRTAGVTKLLEGASNLAYGRCPTAAAAANRTPRPAVGSPQLLPLQGPSYGLSTVSAWTAMLHLTALCMPCEGPPACPLLATLLPWLAALVVQHAELQAAHIKAHLLLVLQGSSSDPLSPLPPPCTTSTWTRWPPSPALPSHPGWPPPHCQSVSLQLLSCAQSAHLPASCLCCRILVAPV